MPLVTVSPIRCRHGTGNTLREQPPAMSTPYDPPQSPVVDPHEVPFSLSRWLGWFYVSFSGRISRKQFWLFLLVPLVVGGAVFQFLLRYLVHVHVLDIESAKNLWILFWVVAWWPSIAVGVKRWHDLNCSGWWVLIGGVPFVGPLVILVANGLFPGTAGDNRFGKDPRSHPDQSEEAFKNSA